MRIYRMEVGFFKKQTRSCLQTMFPRPTYVFPNPRSICQNDPQNSAPGVEERYPPDGAECSAISEQGTNLGGGQCL